MTSNNGAELDALESTQPAAGEQSDSPTQPGKVAIISFTYDYISKSCRTTARQSLSYYSTQTRF